MSDFQDIYSFDSTQRTEGFFAAPDRYRELYKICQNNFIPRGHGSSYVLASAGQGQTSVLSRHFNRIISWNPDRLEIEVESGLSLGNLVTFLKTQGFWFSVLPGHPSVTVGGAVAFNIHGKSQSHTGLFGEHIVSLNLFHPLHGLTLCSREENSVIFDLTIGGMGLTGFITSVKLKVEKLKGLSLIKTRTSCRNIEDAIEIMRSLSDKYENVYSWNNFNLLGERFGRGWVYSENFDSQKNVADIKKFSNLIPPESRNSVLNQALKVLFSNYLSELFELKERLSPASQTLGLLRGAFPFNGKEIYHRFFANMGLLEYQLLVPWTEYKFLILKLERALIDSRIKTSLGSLKIFKGQRHHLHFNGTGLCIAIDAAYSPNSVKLFEKIDQIVIDHGGIPNLSKDSRLKGSVVQSTYKENYQEFKSKLNHWDPKQLIKSSLRQSLCL